MHYVKDYHSITNQLLFIINRIVKKHYLNLVRIVAVFHSDMNWPHLQINHRAKNLFCYINTTFTNDKFHDDSKSYLSKISQIPKKKKNLILRMKTPIQ